MFVCYCLVLELNNLESAFVLEDEGLIDIHGLVENSNLKLVGGVLSLDRELLEVHLESICLTRRVAVGRLLLREFVDAHVQLFKEILQSHAVRAQLVDTEAQNIDRLNVHIEKVANGKVGKELADSFYEFIERLIVVVHVARTKTQLVDHAK